MQTHDQEDSSFCHVGGGKKQQTLYGQHVPNAPAMFLRLDEEKISEPIFQAPMGGTASLDINFCTRR